MQNSENLVHALPHEVKADFTYALQGEHGIVEVGVKRITESMYAVLIKTPQEDGQWHQRLNIKNEVYLNKLLEKDIEHMLGYNF